MEINKDQLNTALSSIRRMANDLKAYRHAEEVIETFVASQNLLGELNARVAMLRSTAQELTSETETLTGKRDTARSELDQEVVRLAEYRKKGLADIEAEFAVAKDDALQKIKEHGKSVRLAAEASSEARQRHEGLLASLHAEIESERAVLTTLRGEIDALKQKFS